MLNAKGEENSTSNNQPRSQHEENLPRLKSVCPISRLSRFAVHPLLPLLSCRSSGSASRERARRIVPLRFEFEKEICTPPHSETGSFGRDFCRSETASDRSLPNRRKRWERRSKTRINTNAHEWKQDR